jgi:hypothetical protein
MLLWQIACEAIVVLGAGIAGSKLMGLATLRHVLPLAAIAAAALAASACWTLAFLPPTAYVNFVRSRSAHS